MYTFSIPYNHDRAILEAVLPNERISEVYLPCSPRIMGSGRYTLKTEEEIDRYEAELPDIIDLIHKRSTKVNLLFNAIRYDEWGQKFSDYIGKYTIDAVSLANPLFVAPIKKEFPNIEIHSSVNSFIYTPQRAKYWKILGADVIAIPDDMNKEINMIKRIKEESGAKIKVIINSICTYGCPFTVIHQLGLTEGQIRENDPFYGVRCNSFGTNFLKLKNNREERQREFLKLFSNKTKEEVMGLFEKIAMIHPLNFSKYIGVVDIFKVIGRDAPSVDLIESIRMLLKYR